MKNPQYYTKEILKKVLPKYCKGRTVDVGAGRSKYKGLISKFCDSYTSVDNASSAYQFDKKSEGPDVVSDVLDMPFKNDEFDTAICTEVLEHVEDPFKLMEELARILKHGGYAIIASCWVAPYHSEPKDYWRFSEDGYRVLCKRSNFKIIEIYQAGSFFTTLLYFVNRNIDLNTKRLRKVRIFLGRINILTEKTAEWLDRFFKTKDAIGHLIIAQKI